MSIHAETEYCDINTILLPNKLFNFFAFSKWIRAASIKKTDLIFLDGEWTKQLQVHIIPAASFITSIHAHPFIQSYKRPGANFQLPIIYFLHQVFIKSGWCITRGHT